MTLSDLRAMVEEIKPVDPTSPYPGYDRKRKRGNPQTVPNPKPPTKPTTPPTPRPGRGPDTVDIPSKKPTGGGRPAQGGYGVGGGYGSGGGSTTRPTRGGGGAFGPMDRYRSIR